MNRTLTLGTLLAVAALISGCTQYTTIREHKDLQQEAQHIGSVVILPPDVSIEKIAFTGENEKEIEKQNTFAREIEATAKSALEGEGLKVVDFDFSNTAATGQNLAFAITQCKEALTKSEETLYKTPVSIKEKDKFAESIGAPANVVAESTSAESMLIVKYNGFEKTAGMKAKDMAAGILLAVLLGSNQAQIAAAEGASIEAALIDTASGDILWTNRSGGPALNTAATKQLFAGLPKVKFGTTAAQPPAIAAQAAAPVAQ